MKSRLAIEAARAKLLAHFRIHPPQRRGDYVEAGKAADVDPRTAKRSYERGWTGLPPLRDVLIEEKVAARALLRKQSIAERIEEAHRAAQEDAVDARANEGKAVRAVQLAAMNSLVALHAEQIHLYQRELVKLMKDPNPASPAAAAARRAYKDIAEIISKLVSANEAGQRMERLLLEAPTAIIGGEVGLRPVVPQNITPEELASEVEAAERALAELQELNEAASEVADDDSHVAA